MLFEIDCFSLFIVELVDFVTIFQAIYRCYKTVSSILMRCIESFKSQCVVFFSFEGRECSESFRFVKCVCALILCFSFSFYWCCHFFSLKTKGNLKCFHLNDWKLDRLISATWFFMNTHQSIENGVHNYYFQFLSSANLMIKLWLVEFFTIMNCV